MKAVQARLPAESDGSMALGRNGIQGGNSAARRLMANRRISSAFSRPTTHSRRGCPAARDRVADSIEPFVQGGLAPRQENGQQLGEEFALQPSAHAGGASGIGQQQRQERVAMATALRLDAGEQDATGQARKDRRAHERRERGIQIGQ
jgi:hypothetical protein